MLTRYGEMLDMVSCLSVYNQTAKLKDNSGPQRITNYEEAIKLR